ncbi:uncharacterized protein SCHCODRAFT_02271611 [Schizophyllum commune H4-8]|uniref:uncharacterized protein n=1 Tax=Schizophyllum commune (strain H4-8 / FGSC 9210) TaxID=578458 RepID=UPI002160D4DF|nr:uncharacterized protein SCHCODRAFT_02271611 [Schizophyllum commune H4-8]KAI5894216.1 hypothetical protein SCHCODRAFT_02271611 [Schizophyllum commune H4-8]
MRGGRIRGKGACWAFWGRWVYCAMMGVLDRYGENMKWRWGGYEVAMEGSIPTVRCRRTCSGRTSHGRVPLRVRVADGLIDSSDVPRRCDEAGLGSGRGTNCSRKWSYASELLSTAPKRLQVATEDSKTATEIPRHDTQRWSQMRRGATRQSYHGRDGVTV